MKSPAGLVIAISVSLLTGVILGWFLSDVKRGADSDLDRQLLLDIFNRRDKVKSVLTLIDDDTRYLYKRINKTLIYYQNAGSGDSIVDLLRHTSAVVNRCADASVMIRRAYEADSIVLEQYIKPE